ncbi:MAG: FMN-binding protein [Acidobacteriota bacterium]|nr:MAG: FMN-binding protein [Acidobacteriota bacterium]
MIRYLAQAWLVILLGLCFGAALAGMQMLVADRIAENKLNETLAQIPVLVPGAERGEPATVGERTVYRALQGDRIVGWVVPAGGLGFGDRIELLVGLDAQAATLTGLYVLEQKETPGLGNKIGDETWRDQFQGKRLGTPLTVVKRDPAPDSAEIRAITGATISSQAVCTIVNQALTDEFRAALAAAAQE